MEPAKLTKLVKGELDWIVMKALEKDRNRRYETANGLGMDVQRFLANETVQACPPSAGYRFRKFVRRNKVSVLAAAVVFLALLAGTIGTALGLIEARRHQQKAVAAAELEKEARIAEAGQRQRAVDALNQVTAEKKKTELALEAATKARTQARAALDSMTDDVIGRLLARQPTLGDEDRAFLQKVLGFYEAFAAERGETAEARSMAAHGQFRVAEVRAYLGEKNAAEKGFAQAVERWEKLAADFPEVADYRQDWGKGCINHANVLADLGKRADAEKLYRHAVAIFDKLAADSPPVPKHRQNLALSRQNLGYLLVALGRYKEAETEYRQALAMEERIVAELPGEAKPRQDLARTYGNLAILLRDHGDRAEAEAAFRQAVSLQEKLAADFPADPDRRNEMAGTHGSLGILFARQGKWPDAEGESRRTLEIYQKLAADFPTVPEYRQALASARNNLGAMLMKQPGKASTAEAEYREGLAIVEKLTADFPALPKYRNALSANYINFGKMLAAQKRPGDALDWFARSIALSEKNLAQDARSARDRLHLRNAYWSRAMALMDLKRSAEAVKDWGRAIELEEGPYMRELHLRRADALARSGNYRGAAADAEIATGQGKLPPELLYNCACVFSICSAACKDDAARAREYADQAMAVLTQAVAAGHADLAQLKADDDLAPLRSREDFKRLVLDPEKKTSPKQDK